MSHATANQSSATLPVASACCTPTPGATSGCCTPGTTPAPGTTQGTAPGTVQAKDAHSVRERVAMGYETVANTGSLGAATGGCCGGHRHGPVTNDNLAEQLGYTPDELASLPEGANMGLSCGNPGAIAGLKPGQTVIDLGSGGGFDCFLAGPKVGDTGRVIGIDMTPAMLTKARNNIAHYQKTTGLSNVEFRLGEIEHLPVADATVDVVISNCVINLSPEKAQVWREIARVLRPGGIAAVSDIVLLRPLPEGVLEMVEALVGCVSGAVLADDYRAMIADAGLTLEHMAGKPQYIAALESFGDELYANIKAALPAGTTPADYLASMDILVKR